MDRIIQLVTSILQVAFYLNCLNAYSKGNIEDNYIGCYYNEVNDLSQPQKTTFQNNATLTIKWCIGQCLMRNATYAGLENSKACLCQNNLGVMLPDVSCNSLCPGNQSEYCGGWNGHRVLCSLYTVCARGYYGSMCNQVCHCRRHAPCDRVTGKCPNECEGKWFGRTCSDIQLPEKYIGCFRDNNTRAISPNPASDRNMTVEMCLMSCILRNSSIAGLQAGSYCSCGENYARYGPLSEGNCSYQCSGNRSQKCGGAFANSVYSVCPAGYYGQKCRNQCHCYNRSRCAYLTGECNSTCKAGWTGNSCNIRDCTTKDGDCLQNEICSTINLNFATITGCRCSPGYDRKASWEMCEGIVNDNYIGCYFDEPKYRHGRQKITLQNNTTLTIELCIGQCLQRNSTYAGLENSKECLCRNNFGVMLRDSSCNALCPGKQSEYCGGSNREKDYYSLYTVCQMGYYGDMCDQVCHCKRRAPCDRTTGKCPNECDGKWFGGTCSDIHLSEKYIGCFRDNSTRAIPSEPYSNSYMTVEFCTNMCALRNNSIAGLQAGSYCFCGENYARYGPLSEGNCSYQCSGNQSQKCGGAFANSVYSVCPAGYYGPKCRNQCHCYNRSRCGYLTGECNSTCKAGWTGNSCNFRDCTTKDGDCFQNETCTTINLNSEAITGCRCSPGYDRKAFWEMCEDIDECVLGLCDASTTDCTNTVGGYNCTCKSGYRQYNETTCYELVKDNYIGCYLDEPKYQHGRQKITLQNNTTLTIELCIGQCLKRNSTYAGLENSKECLCRNNIGVMLPDSSCNSSCPGNQMEYCGGSNGEKEYYSLYTGIMFKVIYKMFSAISYNRPTVHLVKKKTAIILVRFLRGQRNRAILGNYMSYWS